MFPRDVAPSGEHSSERGSPLQAEVPRGAILLIGDELLSGKIRDENGHFLAKAFRRRGISLVEVTVVGDRIDVIGEALLRLCDRASVVVTSGGVGPTHDDVTLAAVAAATGRPLRRDPQMEALLRRHFGPRLTEDALRMSDLPEGTALRAAEGWPVMRLDLANPLRTRIYILPGVPALLRAKFEQLENLPGELPTGQGWHLALLHTDLEESALAPHLQKIVDAFPEVDVGSYPRWAHDAQGRLQYHVRVTFEAPTEHAARAEAAREALASALPADRIVAPTGLL